MTEDEMKQKLAEIEALKVEVEEEAAKAEREVGDICKAVAEVRTTLRGAVETVEALNKQRGYGVGHDDLILRTLLGYGELIERLARMIATPPEA